MGVGTGVLPLLCVAFGKPSAHEYDRPWGPLSLDNILRTVFAKIKGRKFVIADRDPHPPISMLRWEACRIASGRKKVLRSHAFIKCVSLLENKRVVSIAHTAVSFLRHQWGPAFVK